MSDLSGRCRCGGLTWRAEGPILWSAFCHCDDCRRAASSDYVSWLGVRRAGVIWTGDRRLFRSSPRVVRSFCAVCGAPASFETDVFPDETHLYAPSLDDRSLYRPSAHIFWSERLPWVSVGDDLPKHPKGLQDAAANGRSLLR
ncbi:MAG: GFA family protein [Marivibrio sp.]|uniref:GFA family protein n=1 Tax=Marivibrio sp. TaxID=2039719 RepID=UPI0032ECE44A